MSCLIMDLVVYVRSTVYRSMQVIQLDKHIRLLDSPGVVMATKMADEAAMVLRNCVRVSYASLPCLFFTFKYLIHFGI